jgi:hypothetical protein
MRLFAIFLLSIVLTGCYQEKELSPITETKYPDSATMSAAADAGKVSGFYTEKHQK